MVHFSLLLWGGGGVVHIFLLLWGVPVLLSLVGRFFEGVVR